MTALQAVAAVLLAGGAAFFLAGTVGLLRLPDVYARLHALTKVDNLGLGFVVLGLACLADGPLVVAKLLLVWGLVLVSSATAACLVAARADEHGIGVAARADGGRDDGRDDHGCDDDGRDDDGRPGARP